MDDLKIFSLIPTVPSRKSASTWESPGGAVVGPSDGEISVEFRENVRGKDVYVIQPTSIPCNENLMELLVMMDALKRASAAVPQW
jgi:ribose-phosphate pyrophosphokinase